MKDEEWKQIVINDVQYDYLISNHGRVFSLKSQKIKKQTKTKDGYCKINLNKNGKSYTFLIHRLVAIHFILNDDETKTEVNHIDENKENNHVENLEWCTREYNMSYGMRTERQTNTISKTQGKRILCIETGQIFNTIMEACQVLNLKDANIIACLKGRRKTTGGYHWEYVD